MISIKPSLLRLLRREGRKCAIYVIFLLAVLYILFGNANPINWFTNSPNNFKKKEVTSFTPESFKEYCNFMEGAQPLPGEEGKFTGDSSFTLRGVIVVSRHGDRSSMIMTSSTGRKDCGPLSDHQQTLHNGFKSFLSSTNFQKNVLVDSFFDRFPSIPSEYCQPATLTVPGMAQLAKIGEKLRLSYERYGLWDLRGNDAAAPLWHISIRSTILMRTYQSALSFLYGLAGSPVTIKSHIIHFNSSKTLHFCLQQWCMCHNADDRHAQYDYDRRMYVKENTTSSVREVMSLADNIFADSAMKDPGGCMDALAATFVCRRFSLPCESGNGVCVTNGQLSNLFDFITERDGFLIDNENWAAFSIMQALPLLRKIGKVINIIAETKHNYFMYYSTHDTTMSPLLDVLGIFEGVWPRYADHLVFEIWEHIEDNGIVVRILHNGIDVTNRTTICRNEQLCTRKNYFYFINKSIYENDYFTNIDDICIREK